MRFLVLISAVAMMLGCAMNHPLRPTIYTDPPEYLDSFPLGQITDLELVQHAGPPGQTIDLQGRRAFTYTMGYDLGLRTFTYVIEDGVIADVLYTDKGPYNGMTAKSRQTVTPAPSPSPP